MNSPERESPAPELGLQPPSDLAARLGQLAADDILGVRDARSAAAQRAYERNKGQASLADRFAAYDAQNDSKSEELQT